VRDPLEGLSESGTIRTGADISHVVVGVNRAGRAD